MWGAPAVAAAPSGSGFTAIFSTGTAFAALHEDGTIHSGAAVGSAAAASVRRAARGSPTSFQIIAHLRRSTRAARSTCGAIAIAAVVTCLRRTPLGGIHWRAERLVLPPFSPREVYCSAPRERHHPRVGQHCSGGSGAPSGSGFTDIYSAGSRSLRCTRAGRFTRGTGGLAAAAGRAARVYRHLLDGFRIRARRVARSRVGQWYPRWQRCAERHGSKPFSNEGEFAAIDENDEIHVWPGSSISYYHYGDVVDLTDPPAPATIARSPTHAARSDACPLRRWCVKACRTRRRRVRRQGGAQGGSR